MDVTLEELRQLRSTLTSHRLQHETLVTQMQFLLQRRHELRRRLADRSAGQGWRPHGAEPATAVREQ